MTRLRAAIITFVLAFCTIASAEPWAVLEPGRFKKYAESFNADDSAEEVVNFVPNARAWGWMKDNIPLFECPDPDIERIYYFRWWSFRKHIVQTPGGFVLTEFITKVGHAGEFNTISCAAGHHLREGRWLCDPTIIDDYTRFWFRGANGKPEPHFHAYSSWLTSAAYERYLVTGDTKLLLDLLDDFVTDYRQWEKEHQLPSGLFWQFDVRDGMEESISGSREKQFARPTINSYMYGNAKAISAIATHAGRTELAREFAEKADKLKSLARSNLWDDKAHFFKVRIDGGRSSDAREVLGYLPWYFNLPDDDAKFAAAWSQLIDHRGFSQPWGITTAERRHRSFMANFKGKCEWDGPVWPFATSQTLTALGNLLNDYRAHDSMNIQTYFDAMRVYARSHVKDGKPYIGEYQHPETGAWLKGDNPRSRFYNHSTFADLVINGLVGLRPRGDDTIEVNPLIPDNTWGWFCLDGVPYHGRILTILWDKDGSRYHRGRGLVVLVDDQRIAQSNSLKKVTGKLPGPPATRPAIIPAREPLSNWQITDAEMKKIYEEVKTPFKYGVVLRGENMKLIDCPAVFRAGNGSDKWFMAYICMNDVGYETHLAESANLLDWKPLGKILSFPENDDAWDKWQCAGGPALVDHDWNGGHEIRDFDGKYWLTYIGGARQGYETDPLSIGVAWTLHPDEPGSWTRFSGNPILTPKQVDAREFERKTLYRSQVIRDKDQSLGFPFVMFYNAKVKNGYERIGMAVSRDMTSWSRYGEQPVVANGVEKKNGMSGDPQIVRIGDIWVMFYFGAGWAPGAFDTFACSRDLVHWTKWTGPHLIEPGEPWDKTYAHKPWVIKHDGIVYHFYCAVGDQGRVIAVATSKQIQPATK